MLLSNTLTVLLSAATFVSAQNPTATVAQGVIVGTTTSLTGATATVNKFLGIPFAAPPVRFSPPKPAASWSRPLNTTGFAPACIQQFVYPEARQAFTKLVFNTPPPAESEDCLYLNVFAPSGQAPVGGWPVMFWIFGGAFQFGNAGNPYYDGSSFASYQDVIVVTANYRTNVFGFPSSPEIPVDQRNLGFFDQRYALAWVQRNIKSFSGNPEKVTIFGESAGAESVDALVTSSPVNPPFRAAILQSGTLQLRGFQNLGNNFAENWKKLASGVGCPDQGSILTCLRNVSPSLIKMVIERGSLVFQPVVDGKTFVANGTAARVNHQAANISILTGSNGQEGRVFQYGQTNLSQFLDSQFPGLISLQQQIGKAYAIGSTWSGSKLTNDYDAISAIFTDLVFTCPQAKQANESAYSMYPTWRYWYNASIPNLNPVVGTDLQAYHSSEIPIVFGTYPVTGVTAQEYALSQYVQGAWAAFARNPARGPGWNRLGSGPRFPGHEDLGALGTKGSAGVTVIKQIDVDAKCPIFEPIYNVVGGS